MNLISHSRGDAAERELDRGVSSVDRSLRSDGLSESEPVFVTSNTKKRKRRKQVDNLEAEYLHKLAVEEAEEEEENQAEQAVKRQKKKDNPDELAHQRKQSDQRVSGLEHGSELSTDNDEDYEIPAHETQVSPKDAEEQAKLLRTVFLGNVSIDAITSKSSRKLLVRHMSSFFGSLPTDAEAPNRVESLRFRSTAYSAAGPKRAAFAKKELMDTTTKSTNAYLVYSNKVCAKTAAQRLNGSVVLDRHLRVDEVAFPAKTDHRRCVFVGNVGFVDDESQIKQVEEAGLNVRSKPRLGDAEEGLWQQFAKAGKVESVRVIRDAKSRISKGFAYVQFHVRSCSTNKLFHKLMFQDANSVEKALLYNDKKFPPLLPRKLRVVRAKNLQSKSQPDWAAASTKAGHLGMQKVARRKLPLQSGGNGEQSHRGRVRKMSHQSGAIDLGAAGPRSLAPPHMSRGTRSRSKETFAFEGNRDSRKHKTQNLRRGKASRRKSNQNRSAKRGAARKAKGASAKASYSKPDA